MYLHRLQEAANSDAQSANAPGKPRDDSGAGGRHRSGRRTPSSEGPIPSAVHDTWSHRGEGIGRRLSARKNRNNKKKDEPRKPGNSSSNGNPFKWGGPCAHRRTRPTPGRRARGRGRRLGGCDLHREHRGFCHIGCPHVKGCRNFCQVNRIGSIWRPKLEDPLGGKRFRAGNSSGGGQWAANTFLVAENVKKIPPFLRRLVPERSVKLRDIHVSAVISPLVSAGSGGAPPLLARCSAGSRGTAQDEALPGPEGHTWRRT